MTLRSSETRDVSVAQEAHSQECARRGIEQIVVENLNDALPKIAEAYLGHSEFIELSNQLDLFAKSFNMTEAMLLISAWVIEGNDIRRNKELHEFNSSYSCKGLVSEAYGFIGQVRQEAMWPPVPDRDSLYERLLLAKDHVIATYGDRNDIQITTAINSLIGIMDRTSIKNQSKNNHQNRFKIVI